ncbi:permease [Psychrobacillus soli]|uniref:Permease n=1 Tax=Psychrobacillus soli TaxID=1543965 RepID=A0A544SKT8_9BACI|nr:permease [Psychrobacillus soli]TQR05800.1 permease [Psychrobacillus soli]
MRSNRISLWKETFIFLIFGVIVFSFMVAEYIEIPFEISKTWLNAGTIFLSIVLEALPFIFLGVFASALIQTFVSESTVQKWIPKNPLIAIVPVALLSALFPVCECAIIPVVRRLIKKGMPLHLGVILIIGAPILNPIVFASTYYAFQSTPGIAYARMILAFILAIIIGIVVFLCYRNTNQLKWTTTEFVDSHVKMVNAKNNSKLKILLFNSTDEFFDMGKYLIFGTILASLFQTFFNRETLVSLASSDIVSPLVMMGLGFILSLCSEADAFVASSFAHTFSTGSLLAFLLFGPMLDLKSSFMLFAYFKFKFVIGYMVIVTVSVYAVILIFQHFIL